MKIQTEGIMFIALVGKDEAANDFTCRDGEIEFRSDTDDGGGDSGEGGGDGEGDGLPEGDVGLLESTTGYGVRFRLEATADYPTFNLRIALQDGDAPKATLMMQGETARVDAATVDRLTEQIVAKAAAEMATLIADYRRMGQHLLPFRAYAMLRRPDGENCFPSAQAVMLPSAYPPHPEITAYAVTDDTLTLTLRVPVRPQRMEVVAPGGLGTGWSVQTFVSYPLWIPDKEEVSSTLGSVRSATGGTARGLRFSFLSTSRMKHSVAAPEKYYLQTGNAATGYRLASKAAPQPDYSEYARHFGYVPPFAAAAMTQEGCDADAMEWIADWEKSGGGYLPAALPYIYRSLAAMQKVPSGVDVDFIGRLMESTGYRHIVLTRPMTFADAEKSRRRAAPRGVERMRIAGLPEGGCVAVLLGSDGGRVYTPMRQFDPKATTVLLSPPRLFHRLLLLGERAFRAVGLWVDLKGEG